MTTRPPESLKDRLATIIQRGHVEKRTADEVALEVLAEVRSHECCVVPSGTPLTDAFCRELSPFARISDFADFARETESQLRSQLAAAIARAENSEADFRWMKAERDRAEHEKQDAFQAYEAGRNRDRDYAEALKRDLGRAVERAEAAEKDSARLDWLESQADHRLTWIARQSTTGRGLRLHQGHESDSKTAREAIDVARGIAK